MHELYRVSRRPYLIAARPPDLAFNFLRTDYGQGGAARIQPVGGILAGFALLDQPLGVVDLLPG
jgi:hypothetical protein